MDPDSGFHVGGCANSHTGLPGIEGQGGEHRCAGNGGSVGSIFHKEL